MNLEYDHCSDFFGREFSLPTQKSPCRLNKPIAGKGMGEIALHSFTAAFKQDMNVNTANASVTSPAWGLLS